MRCKVCFKCQESLPLERFYKHKKMADGRLNKCIDCTKSDSKQNQERVGNKYDFSKKGVVRVIYKTQKRNQHIRGHGQLPYTKGQLDEWLSLNGFDLLYQSWVDSGFESCKKPSVDRIDDFYGYSFSNIRLVTWSDNREYQHDDIRDGKGTGGKRCKRVVKMDENFCIVDSYHSYSSAARSAGYSIEYQIKHLKKCRAGFYWKYDEELT